MHPNGQLPAYEWAFGDVNPPVHAWAALRVFELDGSRDHEFLERIFQKLLLNFTWWVNRKDAAGDEPVRGRVPRPRQHRPHRPLGAAPRRRAAGAGRRDGVDGHVLPEPAGDRPGPGRARPRLRGHGHQVPGALLLHRDGQRGAVGRGRRLLPRRAPPSRRWPRAAAGPIGRRAAPPRRDDHAGARPRWSACPTSPGGSSGSRPTSPSWPPASPTPTSATASRAGCCRWCRPSASPACSASCSTRPSSCPPTASGPCRPVIGTSRSPSTWPACSYSVDYEPAESTTGPVRRQLQLAGAGVVPGQPPARRGGRALRPLLRRRRDRRVPDRLRPAAHPEPGRRRALPPTDLDVPRRRGRAPARLRRRRASSSATRRSTTACSFNEYFHGDTGAGLGASHQTGWTGLVADLISRRSR